jgi:hypothetical protein
MMIQWLEKLSSEQKICILKAVGRLPDALQGTNENGPSWLWWLLVAMPLNHDAFEPRGKTDHLVYDIDH